MYIGHDYWFLFRRFTSGGGRGGRGTGRARGGRGGRGRGGRQAPPTQDELDKDLDAYKQVSYNDNISRMCVDMIPLL